MKKLKFKDFLMKRIIIWPIIAILVTVLALGISVIACQWYTGFASIATTNQATAYIQRTNSKGHVFLSLGLCFDELYLQRIGFSAAAVIVDRETEEIYLDSEYNIIATISKTVSPTEEVIVLLNKSDELLNVILQFGYMHNVYFDIESIYVDEDGFYPGVTNIKEFENNRRIPENPEIYDFTPENAAELQKYEAIGCFALGTHPNSEVLKDVRAAGKSYETAPLFEFYNTAGVTINGKEYMIRALYRLDFWNFAGKYVLIGGIILTIICVGIAFLTANNKYRKYCTQYEIDEYRRNMTNALAHDLKSPLTAIYGYAENLRNNVHSEKKDYYADAVLENVQYMNEIITNTLDLAKLEISDKGLKREKVDISVLAEELYSKYRPQAESRDISFKISGKAVVSADRKMMAQAVENLISNAVKYTSDGGEIKICVNAESFVISNTTDKMIDAEKVNKPFEKADASRSNRSGSGIGLSIVKNITMLHKFGFETKAENNTFTAKITF